MPEHYIERGTSAGGAPPDFFSTPNANGLYVDGATNEVTVGTGSSGVSANVLLDKASAQTITGLKTFTGGFVSLSEAGATTANLSAFGTSTVNASTSAGNRAYTLGTPVAGYTKYIVSLTSSTSAGTATVAAGSGTTFDGTNATANFLTLGALQLFGLSSARWVIISNSTGVTFSA